MMFLGLSITGVFITFFFLGDKPTSISKTVYNTVYTVYNTALMIMKRLHRPTSDKQFSKQLYLISYFYRGSEYYAIHKIPRGPTRIRKITAQLIPDIDLFFKEKEIDVTEEMRKYAGPNEDFQNNIYLCPDSFGYEELNFYFNDLRVLSYKRFEKILLKE